jgi:4-amino-4-deoxy-L-arabinose transferase-like glycosyltransferase
MRQKLDKDKLREMATLVIIIFVFTAINVRWIWIFRHNQPFDIDEAGYLGLSLINFHALLADGIIGWLRAVGAPSMHAPLTPALSSIIYVLSGPKPIAGFVVTVLAGVVTILASFNLGNSVGGRRFGTLTGILVATSPIIINYSRSYIFALPATAVTTVALFALLRSERLAKIRWAVIFGLCLGLMPLMRTMTIAFVPALFLAAATQVIARPFDRRRLYALGGSFVIAIVSAGTWLIPNGLLVFSYLVTFGYGSRAIEYGPQYSLLTFDAWLYTFKLLAAYIYISQLLFVTMGAALLAILVLRSAMVSGVAPTCRKIISSPLFPSVVLVGLGLTALTSSGNKGNAFVAPLVPAMLLTALWGMHRFNEGTTWRFITSGFVVSVGIVSCVPLIDLSSSVAKPWVVSLPFLGPTILTDGRAPIQKYETDGGYYGESPAIPINSSVGEAWIRVSATTAQKLTEVGAATSLTAFGMRGYLYNANTVNLAQLLMWRNQFAFTQIAPEAMVDSVEGYVRWLRGKEAGTACFLLTASGTIGEIRPVVNEQHIESAARNERFSPIDQWSLPDSRIVKMWKRHYAPLNSPSAASEKAPVGSEQRFLRATFGSWAELEGYSYQSTEDGVQLLLRWRAIEALNQNIWVAIHLIDEKGNILAQDDYTRCYAIAAGDAVQETVMIPTSQLTAAVRKLAIGLYSKDGPVIMAPVDRGARDWAGHRLLLAPPLR